jgi:hypothetical protein
MRSLSSHRLGLAQPVDAAQGYEEDVLDDVLGLLRPVTQEAESQSVKRRPVALEQDPEADRITSLGRSSALRVAQHREPP